MKYKGQIVFEKLSTPYFERVPKEYKENEACFIFINQGEMSLRSQTAYFKLKSGDGLLAKCLNYFFETNETQRTSSEGIEVVGVIFGIFNFKDNATADFNNQCPPATKITSPEIKKRRFSMRWF